MIYFSCACYVFFSFVQAKAAISSFPNELINRASGNLGFVTQDQQDPVLGDQTATPFQDSADLFDNFALNPSDSPISNLPPNNNFDSTPGRGDDGGETTSLLFDESVGGGERTGISIPSAPIQIPDGLPDVINGIRQWLSNPKKPECKENKHPLCCEKGAPSLKDGNPRSGGRRPSIPPKVIFEPLEYSQRRRVCRSCTRLTPYICSSFCHSNLIPFIGKGYDSEGKANMIRLVVGGGGGMIGSTDALACQFPENIFCCYCQDYVCTCTVLYLFIPTHTFFSQSQIAPGLRFGGSSTYFFFCKL